MDWWDCSSTDSARGFAEPSGATFAREEPREWWHRKADALWRTQLLAAVAADALRVIEQGAGFSHDNRTDGA